METLLHWLLHPRGMWKLRHLSEAEKAVLRKAMENGGRISVSTPALTDQPLETPWILDILQDAIHMLRDRLTLDPNSKNTVTLTTPDPEDSRYWRLTLTLEPIE